MQHHCQHLSFANKVVGVIQEAAKKAADARKRQRKSGDKSKEGKSAEAKPKSSKVCPVDPA